MFNFKTPDSPACQLCLSYVGARFAMVLVIGVLIGGVATQFVEFPPSTMMIQAVAQQEATAGEVDSLKIRTTNLETDVRKIKDHIKLP